MTDDWELETANLYINVGLLLKGRMKNIEEWMRKMGEISEELDIRLIYKKVSSGPIKITDGYYDGNRGNGENKTPENEEEPDQGRI